MHRHLLRIIALPALAALLLAGGCKDAREDAGGTTAEGEMKTGTLTETPRPRGKPTAPIAIDYDIIGVPIVGHPVNIDVAVSTTEGEAPVKLRWHVLDPGSLSFPEAQLREVAVRVSQRQPQTRQVTVVPQREGRLYLNVTAEVEAPGGAMLKSIAIPIQVGSAAGEPEPEGEVRQDDGGGAIESLPADEG